MMVISRIVNLGTELESGSKAFKIKITNIVGLIACLIASLYAGYFFVALESALAASMNMSFVVLYGITLLLSHLKLFRAAKIWISMILIVHVFILSSQIFTNGSGFHYYYLIIPSGVFLLFDSRERFEKPFLLIVGVALFFVCDNYINPEPLVELSSQAERNIFTSTILVVMLEVYLVMHVFSQAIVRNEDKLKNMARKDPLTGVNNRRLFIEVGEELIENAKRYDHPLSLLIFDIDFFKKINDNFGHIAGDKILKNVASILDNNIRASDTLARFGGEEFTIILSETSCGVATEIAENLRVLIEQDNVLINNQEKVGCTVSIGIAQFNQSMKSLNELISHADKALYKAKEQGRNQVVVS